MLDLHLPALVLAPMDGVTDPTMRAFMGRLGAFSYAVSEFVRVSADPLPAKVFRREVPELLNGGRTLTGMPVQVQILGGDPEKMALSARAAYAAGATAIDLNFGCPAPTVNRNDGGASLLRAPCRIRDIVRAVRDALPPEVPVSAKLRLGWDTIDAIRETSAMAAEGGAAWLTIHAPNAGAGVPAAGVLARDRAGPKLSGVAGDRERRHLDGGRPSTMPGTRRRAVTS